MSRKLLNYTEVFCKNNYIIFLFLYSYRIIVRKKNNTKYKQYINKMQCIEKWLHMCEKLLIKTRNIYFDITKKNFLLMDLQKNSELFQYQMNIIIMNK